MDAAIVLLRVFNPQTNKADTTSFNIDETQLWIERSPFTPPILAKFKGRYRRH